MSDDKQDQDLLKQKEVAFYSSLVHAWISTRMEKDRTLLAISSVGIGAIITLLTAFGIDHYWEIILCVIPAFSFLLVITILISVLGRNAKYIQLLIDKGKEKDFEKRKVLEKKSDREKNLIDGRDRYAFCIFLIGLVFTVIVIIFSTFNNIQIRSAEMDEEKSNVPTQQSGQTQSVERGLGGLENLEPGLGGLGGLGNLDSQESSDTQEGEGNGSSDTSTSEDSGDSSD